MSIFEFQTRFPNNEACKKYLSDLKWSEGYSCKKCAYRTYRKGQDKYMRKCNRCSYQESPTAGTLFHKLKFPLLKAFYIIYYVSTNKKGISSMELSRKLALRQKTCWLFKRKVMTSMESTGNYPLNGFVEIDETFVGGKEKGRRGRSKGTKKLVAFILKTKGKGILRAYGKVIKNAGTKELRPFIEKHVDKEAKIKTDQWRGYRPLQKEYKNLVQVASKQGRNFNTMHRFIMNFKSWLRGIHHSVKALQAYIDEYTYRFNRHFMNDNIFDNLLMRVFTSDPKPYKIITGR